MSTGRLYLSSIFERAKELNLSPSKRLMLCDLFRYMGDKDYCYPSQQSIAKDTGLKVRQIRNLLKELAEKDKVIEITTRKTTGRKHGNHAYEYRFTKTFIQGTPKAATGCLSDETKAAISDQTKAAICDIQKCLISRPAVSERVRNQSKE